MIITAAYIIGCCFTKVAFNPSYGIIAFLMDMALINELPNKIKETIERKVRT